MNWNTLIDPLTVPVTILVVEIVKWLLPLVPARFLPILAAVVGIGANYAATAAAGLDSNTPKALILGLAATGLHQMVGKLKTPPIPPGAMLLAILAPLLLVFGCARFNTVQEDRTWDTNGLPARFITTRATSYTLFTSKSQLANFKATQTDKTQSATVGLLAQESSEPAALSNIVSAAVGAAVKAAKSP